MITALTEAWVHPDLKQLRFTLPLSTMGKRDMGTKGKGKNVDNKRNNATKALNKNSSACGPKSKRYALRRRLPAAQPTIRAEWPGQIPKKGKSTGKGKGGGGGDNSKVNGLRARRISGKLHLHKPIGGGLICYYSTWVASTGAESAAFTTSAWGISPRATRR